MSKAGKIVSIILGAFLVLVVGAYTAGVIVFEQKIMPNTSLSAGAAVTDISWQEPEEIAGFITGLEEKTMSVQLDNDPDRVINLQEDIDYHNNAGEIADNILKDQQVTKWDWPIRVFRQKDLSCSPVYTFNQEKLDSLISGWTFTGEIPSEDAYLDLNEKEEIIIVPEKYGTVIDKADLAKTAAAHISEHNMQVSKTELTYLEPEIRKDNEELKEQLKTYEEGLNRDIIVDIYGIEETLHLRDLISIPDYFYNWEYVINEEKIDQYMNYLLETYDTYEKPRRFKTHDGRSIMVGGTTWDGEDETYGFSLNYEQTRNNILYTLYDPTATRTEVAWYRVGNEFTVDNSDIGHTYIEISLAEQHLWYFENGTLLLDTPIVTGLDTPQKRTPAGVYATMYKGRNVTLTGEMGGETWNSFVNYWMAITPTGIGIHDAPWRGTSPAGYGGNIYQYNGSHGCINVPLDNEIFLYNHCPEGTCVVVY